MNYIQFHYIYILKSALLFYSINDDQNYISATDGSPDDAVGSSVSTPAQQYLGLNIGSATHRLGSI